MPPHRFPLLLTRTQATYWWANFGADDPFMSHFSEYRPAGWVNQAAEPHSTPNSDTGQGNGNRCSWEYRQRCCSIAANLIPVGPGDPAGGRQFSGENARHGPIMKISARWWVIRLDTRPSTPNPRLKLPQSHSCAHLR